MENEEYRRRTMAEFLLKQASETKDEPERESLRLFAMSLKDDILPEGYMEKLEQGTHLLAYAHSFLTPKL